MNLLIKKVCRNKEDNMKRMFLVLLLIIGSFIHAQTQNMAIPINISYFGETITHPGIEIGYENTFYNGFNISISIGTYVHQRNHTGLFINGGINWRHTFPVGYSPEIGIGLGFLNTWAHGGSTYIVDDDGNVSINRSGRSHFMPSIKLGLLGWDLRQRTNIPMRINTDIIIFGQYPFNNYILPHVALKLGATYYFELRQNESMEY